MSGWLQIGAAGSACIISKDFAFEIQKGNITGHSLVTMVGHNNAVGAAIEDIRTAGGTYTFLDTAIAMTLSSDNANDTVLGTGARTVLISGLDNNYNLISETKSLAGQTAVALTNSYLRVHEMRVLTAGANNQAYNLGNIYVGSGTVTAGVPAVIHQSADIGENYGRAARYTIPLGYTGYMLEHDFSATGNNVAAECFIYSRLFGEAFVVRRRFMAVESNYDFRGYAILPEKSDIVARAYVSQGSTDIASSFTMILVANTP
jgi:hypothetical protein